MKSYCLYVSQLPKLESRVSKTRGLRSDHHRVCESDSEAALLALTQGQALAGAPEQCHVRAAPSPEQSETCMYKRGKSSQ